MITGIGCFSCVRSSAATTESGRLCLTLPKRRFSPAASSQNPVSHRRHPPCAHSAFRLHDPIAASGRLRTIESP